MAALEDHTLSSSLTIDALPSPLLFMIFKLVPTACKDEPMVACPVRTLLAISCCSKAWNDALKDPALWTSLIFFSSASPTPPFWTFCVRNQVDDQSLAALIGRSEGGLSELSLANCPFPSVTTEGLVEALSSGGYEGKLLRLDVANIRVQHQFLPFVMRVPLMRRMIKMSLSIFMDRNGTLDVKSGLFVCSAAAQGLSGMCGRICTTGSGGCAADDCNTTALCRGCTALSPTASSLRQVCEHLCKQCYKPVASGVKQCSGLICRETMNFCTTCAKSNLYECERCHETICLLGGCLDAHEEECHEEPGEGYEEYY